MLVGEKATLDITRYEFPKESLSNVSTTDMTIF